jgi:hypothetical protein
MKRIKIILGIVAVLAITTVVMCNINLSSKIINLPDVSLRGTEAQAGLAEWWNSKVYMCETRSCSYTYSLGFWSATYYGTYSNCISGSSCAHCWDCDSGCDAY